VHHAILLVDRAMATTQGAGSVATLNFAYRLALVVGQLSGLAVSTALFPRMVEQAVSDDLSSLRSSLASALRFVWMVGLPATCGLIVLRSPLVQVLYERGAFDSGATAAVSDVLIWYALAVLADALCQPLWRVLYARKNARLVFGVNSLQTAVRVVCNVALIQRFGYNGLALSAAIGLSIQLFMLGFLVRRRIGAFLMAQWWRGAARVVLATMFTALAASLLVSRLSTSSAWAALLVSGTAGGLAYLGILFFLEKRAS
jgi:putative peptidoglycan lipid II flippase